jgi:hypothetical protein
MHIFAAFAKCFVTEGWPKVTERAAGTDIDRARRLIGELSELERSE